MNDLSIDYRKLMGKVGETLSTEQPEALILGLGESGLSMAKWFLRCGYPAKIADTRLHPPKLEALQTAVKEALKSNKGRQEIFFKYYLGPWNLDLLHNVKLVAISPGLSIHDPCNAVLISQCRAKNIPVWGEFEFFSCALKILGKYKNRPYLPKILAVTGTNGKTTVCKLVHHLLKQCNFSSALAGNVSPALMEVFRDSLENSQKNGIPLPEVWIIEASSFQLMSSLSFFADAAALLNVTPDHLDWHDSFSDYSQAKQKIFHSAEPGRYDATDFSISKTMRTPTLRVLCRDDEGSMAAFLPGNFCITVGSDLPKNIGDYGVCLEKGIAWLVEAVDIEKNSRLKEVDLVTKQENLYEVLDQSVRITKQYRKILPCSSLQIRGHHNICNALAALTLTRSLGAPLERLSIALTTYTGESHRMEPVRVVKGVSFIDDSKATNVGATLAALRSIDFFEKDEGKEMLPCRKKCLLIAGGDGKGQDFLPLARPISQICRAVFLIGKDASKIAKIVNDPGIQVTFTKSLEEAVTSAMAHANHGDVILLSPACASWDMFKNYEHRAAIFRDVVMRIC